MKTTVEGLEKERDFYFSKLRDIELLLQNAVEENPELEKDENGLIKHVQAILYSTEVKFNLFPFSTASNGDHPQYGPLIFTLFGESANRILLQEGFEIPEEGAAVEGNGEDLETF